MAGANERQARPAHTWKTPEVIIGVGGLIVSAIFGFAQCSSPAATVPPLPTRQDAPSAPPLAGPTPTPTTSAAGFTTPTATSTAATALTLLRTCEFDAKDDQAIDLDTCRMIPYNSGPKPLGIDLTLGNNGRLSTSASQTHGLFKLLDPTTEACAAAIQSQSGATDTLENYNNQLYKGSAFCMVTGDGTTAIVTVTKATPTPDTSFDGGISLKADLYK